MRSSVPLVAGFAMLLASLPALAEPPKEAAVEFLTPAEAIEKMTYPEGFVVKAFAAEPGCQQPFAFTFDERGRVWLCENMNYETRSSDSFEAGPLGRIVILTDTDGDGQMDERKVFKDKIFFPSGIALGFGGVYVGSPPNLLFIPDKNRDDIPDDEPVVKLDGWGRQDRHEVLNSFLWGPDGWLYGCQGVFTHSRVGVPGTPDAERVPINAGVWRYHPQMEKFEVFAWGVSNQWGLDFDDHGQMFVTACVIPHLWHLSQGGRYHRQAGSHFNPHVYDDIKTITDHKHASAHGGARFYLADQFPEEYRGRLFMCNIHEHGILTDKLEREGSGFVGRHGDHFCMANDPQWLGFNMELGPDGSMYAIDWHDSDICGRKILHQKTGRVWRISYGDVKFPTSMDLTKRSDAELVEMQMHKNDWYVRQARRLLQERAAAGTLAATTRKELLAKFETVQEEARELRFLWCLHVTGGCDPEFLSSLLGHSHEYVRAWAIQFLLEDGELSVADRGMLSRLATEDPSPVVRLYLASALQRLPVAVRPGLLLQLLAHAEDNDDHNLPLMIWYALEPYVAAVPEAGARMAGMSEIDLLSRYMARRIASEVESQGAAPPPGAKKAAAAKSVSKKGLVLHMGPGELEGKKGRIAQWGEAKQDEAGARPAVREALGGRRALWFDGTNDRLEIPHRDELSFRKGDDFTLSVRVYLTDLRSGWIGLVNKSRVREPWYGLWIDPGGRWLMGGADNVPGPKAQAGWNHVCMTQKNGRRTLYVDGYEVIRDAEATDGNGPGALWIGGADSVKEFFRGGINEVRLYRRGLSAGEVAYLAEHPVGVTATGGGSNEGFKELVAVLSRTNESRLHRLILTGMREGLAGKRGIDAPPGWEATFAKLSKSPSEEVRELAQGLSVLFGDEASLTRLQAVMMDEDADLQARRGALETLVEKRAKGLAPQLQQLLGESALRSESLAGLAAIAHDATPDLILQGYPRWSPQQKIDAINTLTSRVEFGRRLLDAVEAGKVPRKDVSATAARQLANLDDKDVLARLTEVWGEIRPTPEATKELFAHYRKVLGHDKLRKANPKLGREVYARSCGQCHQMFGVGGTIGPDLTGSDRRNVEYILDNVLDPNGAIGKDYQYTTFTLADERVVLGIIKEESDKVVKVQTLAGDVTIGVQDIKERKQLPVSMMPDGLFQTLTDAEVRNLVRYLQAEDQIE